MRVFFTTPFGGKEKYQRYIDEILTTLRKHKLTIMSPEDGPHYQEVLQDLRSDGLNTERAHYAFITHSIAEADIIVIEASYEDFRVGHEVTLALLYNKPTLVLSQHTDYSKYIPHELLFGAKYTTTQDLRKILRDFIAKAELHLSKAKTTSQAIGGAADSLHMAALATSRHQALRLDDEFGSWARLAEKNPDKAYASIQKSLGKLPVEEPWSVFAPIYNEDTPDYIFGGVARFIHTVFNKYHVKPGDPIVDAATGTGGVARNLTSLGYREVYAFDASREMLAEAFRLCAHIKSVKLLEAEIGTFKSPKPAKGIAWIDYSSNFALTEATLKQWLEQLLANLAQGGCIVFDIRTLTGWQVNFFRQKVTTFATDNFQRIWINLPEYDKKRIAFDIFIRTRSPSGTWSEWHREQMSERMWSLDEVKSILVNLKHGELEAIYGDNFTLIDNDEEPGLAYIVIKKTT